MIGDDDTSWLDDVDEEAEEWLRDQAPAEGDLLSPQKPERSESENAFLQVLFDDSTPSMRNPPAVPAGTDAKYVESIRALKRIRPNQRTFIRALVQEAGSVSRALKLYNARHSVKLNHSQVSRWCHNPDYLRALTDAKNYFLDMHGIDPQSTLLKAAHLYEQAMTPTPILYQGRATGYYENDRGNAAKMIEFMGKANGLVGGEDKGVRVTVQVVNLSSREKKAQTFDG